MLRTEIHLQKKLKKSRISWKKYDHQCLGTYLKLHWKKWYMENSNEIQSLGQTTSSPYL